MSDAAEDVIGVIRAGARGYVTKSISADELRSRRAADPRRRRRLLAAPGRLRARRLRRRGARAVDPELDLLTGREREVLRYIARGYTYKEVAHELHISVKTVETHVSAVLRKLQLSSRYELTRWAADRRRLSVVMPYDDDPRVDAYIDSAARLAAGDLPARSGTSCTPPTPRSSRRSSARVQPYFVLDGNICALLAAKDHVNVFLYDGGIVPDPEGIITAGHDNKTGADGGIPRGRARSTPRADARCSSRSSPTIAPAAGAG